MKNDEAHRLELRNYAVKVTDLLSERYGDEPNSFGGILCGCLASFAHVYETREEERGNLLNHLFERIKEMHNDLCNFQKEHTNAPKKNP